MAAATAETQTFTEPLRTICNECALPVLVVVVPAIPEKRIRERVVMVDPWEWEPRARCYVCKNIESRAKTCPKCRGLDSGCKRCEGTGRVNDKRGACDHCGGDGYVGRSRPPGIMLGIDIAWSDDGHVRLIGPSTDRRRGEALYAVHACIPA